MSSDKPNPTNYTVFIYLILIGIRMRGKTDDRKAGLPPRVKRLGNERDLIR